MRPMTRSEAMAYRYNVHAGNPGGFGYDSRCCAEEVYDPSTGTYYQCWYKPGREEIYCEQCAQKFGAQEQTK